MRLFQGEQGPQGVLGPRGLPGEGFSGAKVSDRPQGFRFRGVFASLYHCYNCIIGCVTGRSWLGW